jgi:cyanophycin synthetase
MLKDQLLQEGIHADAIETIPDEQEATRHALEIAKSGDLVLVLGDNVRRTWKQIIYFNSSAHAEDVGTKAPAAIELPETEDFTFDSDVEIISDERGVRIAREEAD